MKINTKSLKRLGRAKKVYYYDRKNGVLEKKVTTRYRLMSGALVAVFMLAGASGVTKYVVNHVEENRATASMQRQTVAVDTTQKAEEEDKLKNVEKKAREDEQLSKSIKSKLKNVPGGQKWSVYVRDVNSDRMANVNSDNVIETAGLENLLVTMPLEAKQPAHTWNYRAGKSTIVKCVEEMIRSSDDTCEQSINRYANLANASSVLNGHGLKKTTLTAKDKKTTARDLGELLFRLQNGQVLGDKARRAVFDGLYSQKMREGIPASCTSNCLVANITGEGEGLRHDAGIVTTGNSKYVVVVMTQGASWSQIADVSSMIRTELQP